MLAVLVIGGYVLLVLCLMLWGRYAQMNNPLMDDTGNVVEPYKPKPKDACTD